MTSTDDQDNGKPGGKLEFLGVQLPKETERFMMAFSAAALGIFCAAPMKTIGNLVQLLVSTVGTAVGVGMGLGLAMHVYERLQEMQKAQEEQKRNHKKKRLALENIRPKSTSSSRQSTNMNVLEDGTSYVSLMATAGYFVEDKVLRGQVLKESDPFWGVKYRFTDVTVDKQLAPRLLRDDWPSLPEPVARELGRFVEHVMRDYVSGWYSRLDTGCIFLDERRRRKDGIPRDGRPRPSDGEPAATPDQSIDDNTASETEPENDRTHLSASSKDQGNKDQGNKDNDTRPPQETLGRQSRKMVFSTKTHRRIPMLDQTYKTMSAAFGNLATRAEHVNIFSLALLKWTQVLAHTFKVYRTLRATAQQKSAREHPSEIQVTREFLLAGKLHRAVTFGLDVPSLLFADTTGKECGTGTDKPASNPDQVLEQRLFGTTILSECELDYNRVVAHRLVRALIPRSDAGSNVILALVVEIFGTCVLQPLMNLWIPSFLNNIIKKVTANKANQDKTDDEANVSTSRPTKSSVDNDCPVESRNGRDHPVSEAQPVGVDDKDNPNAGVPVEPDSMGQADQSMETEYMISARNSPGNSQTPSLAKGISSISNRSSDVSVTPLAPDLEQADDSTDGSVHTVGHVILSVTTWALQNLQKYMDFEQCRIARTRNVENGVEWDDPACQEAVLKLVMVLEAAILHGRIVPPESTNDLLDGGSPSTAPGRMSMSQLLMEMTSDMDNFEINTKKMPEEQDLGQAPEDREYELDSGEISTLRTLISTWLHTGQAFRALSLLVKGSQTIFARFYNNRAFLRNRLLSDKYLDALKVLDGLDIMVETMAVLAMPKFEVAAEAPSLLAASSEEIVSATGQQKDSPRVSSTAFLRSGITGFQQYEPTSGGNNETMTLFPGVSIPRYLDFHRNAAFASSLRAERERRIRSWGSLKADESLQTICRKSALQADIDLHQELHNLSRMFYNGTNVITIRDAARKSETTGQPQTMPGGEQEKVSLLTVEMVSNRRRIEVPDDDSSFLLRAQPRPLNPVSVHRDDRNHDQSYKCFLATYEEPAIHSGSHRYNGGRYIRRCFLQYYPGDRTASVILHNDARKLDKRKGLPRTQEQSISKGQNSASYLPGSFLRERHLCQKWTSKGTGTQNFLSSTVMETSDFNATPRSGKALDFVYRMSLFEKPAIDLSGKRFLVHDSAGRGPHRADASCLEVSDASLSSLLLTIGRDLEESELRGGDASFTGVQPQNGYRHMVEMGPDGYPMIFMKFSTKQGDQVTTEIKPYRLSFVRAALLVTSARQEAQLQCLVECVKAGSAKSATKARTEAQLRPTLKILEYANDVSPDKSKSASLLRDLKLGIYHIDREQLRRNGLLNPRSPTTLVALSAKVEGSVQAKDVAEAISGKLPPTSTLYKIRCVAFVELHCFDDEADNIQPYALDDGTFAKQYREEWVIFRSMKDFQALHRHLKTEVAAAESSASTGSRLVGAATAAFGSNAPDRKQRKALIPSLAQASKTGALAVTKKAIARRGELLDEYLDYLLTPNHLISRCIDLLLFLGASLPFPPDVKVLRTPSSLVDPLGRLSFIRSVSLGAEKNSQRAGSSSHLGENCADVSSKADGADRSDEGEEPDTDAAESLENLAPPILNKVDQVPLADVRNRIVELVRYQFGFENASFFRSRMLAALETASFVAITKASDFRKVLYDLHVRHLNPDALAGWIEKILDILWPDGVWLIPAPLLSEEEEATLREESRESLHDVFPDQLRVILGKELTKDGLDIVHEMLQNRVVVKSLFYMLFDLLWIEIFPELRDVLTCASALDIE